MGDEILSALIEDIKNDLDITWADNAMERKIRRMVRSGVAYLNSKLGHSADYSVDGYPRTLLFEYVRYARDGALDVFENNYKSMILAMQNEWKVVTYAKDTIPPEF